MENQKKWWREKDYEGNSIIRFTVTSDGKTGPEWVKYLKDNGYELSEHKYHLKAKEIINSNDFVRSNNITYDVVVLKGNTVRDSSRCFERILREGKKRKYEQPPIEVACLIREKFTDEEIKKMGLWMIMIMHGPIKNHKGSYNIMCIDRDEQKKCISVYSACWKLDWNDGFAFILPVAPKK